MKCCQQCEGVDRLFDTSIAKGDLESYHKNGPAKATRLLLDALKAESIAGMTLLDIGGGVGAIQHELLKAGASRATNIDASRAYIETAKQEAQRQGHGDRVSYQFGDFVALAPDIDSADIVTLDRVICCYHDMPSLVSLSAAHAKKFYGLIYPCDSWWMRLGRPIFNCFFWIQRHTYRFFLHPTEAVNAVIQKQGFTQHFYAKTWLWQVVIYARG